MTPVELVLDLRDVESFDDFHRKSKKLFGFPEFYGNNIRAWVDCVRSIRDLEEGMSSINISDEEILVLRICGYSSIEKKLPELIPLLFWAVAVCNQSEIYLDRGPVLTISF